MTLSRLLPYYSVSDFPRHLRPYVCDSQDWRGTGRSGVRITIADNGSGIPHEIRHKLFEPFFTTKREKGTGLGLWVTKSLVDKQDGSLRVHSTPGVGTAFSVFLPSNLRRGWQLGRWCTYSLRKSAVRARLLS